MKLRAAVCLCLIVGCDSAEEPPESKPSSEAKAEQGKAEDGKAEDGKAKEGEAKGKTEEGKAEEGKPEASADCPEELTGSQEGDLVIGKSCTNVSIKGTYRVDGGSLTIEGGASIAFADGAELSIGYSDSGKLIVNGTAEAPVTFTSKGDKAPGVWKGVRLHKNAARSSINGLLIEYGGDRRGAIAVDASDVTIKGSKFQHLREGGVVVGREGNFAVFEDNEFTDVGNVAMRMPAQAVGGLGLGNKYGEGSKIVVPDGSIEGAAHWLAQSTAMVVGGEIKINGTDGSRAKLEIDPGVRLEFDSGGRLSVGYYANASLTARGTKENPVVFTSTERKEAGAWRGVFVRSNGEATIEHATFEYGGSRKGEGVLYADGNGRLSAQHCTFQSNTEGVVLKGKGVQLEGFSDNTFKKTPLALQLDPPIVGSVGENTYENDAVISINGGTVAEDAKWVLQSGAVVQLNGNLQVSGGRLELPAGFELQVKDGTSISIGYYDTGALLAAGTADKPIRFVGQRDAAGAWKSLTLYDKAKGNEISHLVLKNASDPGVDVRQGADGKIEALTCESCAGEAIKKHDASTIEISG